MFFLSSATSDPRAIAQSDRSLPGAQEISVIVHTPSNVGDKDPNISYMIMLFIISAKFTHYAKNCPKMMKKKTYLWRIRCWDILTFNNVILTSRNTLYEGNK
jgi:hypothetical protein